MKQIVQNPGGRRYFGEDFMNPQEEILLGIIEPFLAEFGQFIFCGCTLTGNTISKGVVILNSKACKFEGKSSITTPYYVRYATKEENVDYKTGTDVGFITYFAEPCLATDAGAFRLDNAPRFADIFKPKNAINADTVDNKHATDFATSAQGAKADIAVQSAKIGTTPVAKSGTELQLPAYPISLPANGGNADTVDDMHAADFVPKLAVYSRTEDPNTTPLALVLTAHVNCPTHANDDDFYYIRTIFYDTTSSSRFQLAYKYDSNVAYTRQKQYNTAWSAWKNVADSGNADTVDGKHASDFAPSGFGLGTLAQLLPDGTDINTISKSGFYRGSAITNRPTNGWMYYIVISHTTTWVTQLAVSSGSSTSANELFTRVCIDGVWGAWKKYLAEPAQLPIGTNLNNITAVGFYYCPAISDAGTMSNLPISTAFSLFVEKHAGTKQTFTQYDASNPSTWVRSYYNGVWGAWKKVVMHESNGDIIAFKTS